VGAMFILFWHKLEEKLLCGVNLLVGVMLRASFTSYIIRENEKSGIISVIV